MHVLLLPKWYPGENDPQLGDFLRKQALATAATVRMSVLVVEASTSGPLDDHLLTTDGAWELFVRYRASENMWLPWRKVVNFLRYWNACNRGWARVIAERGLPELLHAYILVRPVLFAWWIARRHHLPYLISEQSSEYLDGTYRAKGSLFKALNRFLFRRAARITAVSKWLGDGLVEHGLCARYDVVPNVVPGLDRPLPSAGEPGQFMMVADLVDKTKNVSGVLRALSNARKNDPRIQLTVIGDGPDRAMLEELAGSLGLQQHVSFLGRMPNTAVLDHMANTFAVIINSNVETFSVVTGEALAQGKPVIATRCGGPQAFITRDNGMLIDPRDDAALCMAMLQLTASAANFPPDRIRATVGSRFSNKAVGEGFHTIYEDIVHHAQ